MQERFLTFVDCCKKIGLEISMLILETLKKFGIPLADCRGQGYDNAANMSGKYNGAQQHILAENPLCLYSPCACQSLNHCGADSAACCDIFWYGTDSVQPILLKSPAMVNPSRKHWVLTARPVRMD